MKKIYSFILAMFAVLSVSATDYYLTGDFNGWNPNANKFTQTTDGYEIIVDDCYGAIKVLIDGQWGSTNEYCAVTLGDAVALGATYYTLQQGGQNLKVGRDGYGYTNAKFKLQVSGNTLTLTFVSGTEYSRATTYQIVGGYNEWKLEDAIQFERIDGVLTATVPNLSGEFKVVSNRSWDKEWATNLSTNAKLEFNVPYVMSEKSEGQISNLSLANPFGGYTNAKLTLQVGEDGTMTLTLIDGMVNRTEADWYMPGEVLGWNCTDAQKLSPVEGEDNTYQITIPNFGDRFKFVYGNWLLQFGATGDQKWQLNEEYTCSLTESDIHAEDDATRYTSCTVTLVVDYETGEVKFTITSPDVPTSLQQTKVEPVATKIIENGQVLIIKDGVRYNMMGVKVD